MVGASHNPHSGDAEVVPRARDSVRDAAVLHLQCIMASDGSDAEINKIQKASTRHLAGHRKTVHSLAWSTDALHLASGSIDQTVRIWLVDDTGHVSIVSSMVN